MEKRQLIRAIIANVQRRRGGHRLTEEQLMPLDVVTLRTLHSIFGNWDADVRTEARSKVRKEPWRYLR